MSASAWDGVECWECGGKGVHGWESPEQCRCNNGVLFVHKTSGVIAIYPGGPLLGRMPAASLTTEPTSNGK